MTGTTLAERNTIEKARRAAMASNAAMAERKAADEEQARASKKSKKGNLDEVPPFCYLSPELSPDEAAVIAVRELRISLPIDALAMLWKMRRVAQGDAK